MDEISNQSTVPPLLPMEEKVDCPIPRLSKYSTREEFQNWKETLLNYLNLNNDNKKFLHDGVYSEWSIVKGDKRISKLNYKYELGSKSITELSNKNCSDLLAMRNSELNDLILLILKLANYIGRDAVLYQSESVNMIFDIISEFIDFESNNNNKLEISKSNKNNILEIAKMNFDVNNSYESFYTQFRSCIIKHAVKYEDKNCTFPDEVISPFLEDVIIVWCLEKFNPLLPTQIENKFCKLLSNSSLLDLRIQIFESIPDLLSNDTIEIDDEQNETTLSAVDENFKEHKGNEHRPSVNANLHNKKSARVDYDCGMCKMIFETKDEMDKHMNFAHKINVSSISEDAFLKCKLCQKTLPSKYLFKRHNRDGCFPVSAKIQMVEPAVQENRSFNCDICKKIFTSRDLLERHTNWVHKSSNIIKNYTCDKCRTVWNDLHKYLLHAKWCTTKDSYKKQCEVCRASFTKESLLLHKKQKHSDLLCCGEYFTSKYALEIHTRLYCIVDKNVVANEISDKITTSDNDETDLVSDICKMETVERKEIETDTILESNEINDNEIKSTSKKKNREHPHESNEISTVPENEIVSREFDQIESSYFDEQETVQDRTSEVHFITNPMKVSDYPKEQVFIQIEGEQHNPPKPTTPIDPENIVIKDGVKYLKNIIIDREVYNCIVCQKMLSSKENMYLHMKSHFPGTEHTSLFAQLLESMKPSQVHRSEYLEPLPKETSIPEDIDVKLEINDIDENKKISPKRKYTKKLGKMDNETPEKQFPCGECGKILKSKQLHKVHQVKHFGCICEECGASFDSLMKLKYHNMKKHKGEKFVCSECGKSLCNKISLERHINSRHTQRSGEKDYSCEVCGVLFDFDWQLKNHLTKHKNSNKKSLSCKTCFRTFINKSSLLDHVCKHYTCNICEAKFLRERNLKLHKRIHCGENVFDCDMCEALFETKKRLNSHKSTTHSDLKKWTCKDCPRAFKTSSGLKQHVLSHTGEKPIKCDTCNAQFKTKAHLKSHSLIHNNQLPHQCNGCGQNFRELTRFKAHREKNSCGITDQDRYKGEEALGEACEVDGGDEGYTVDRHIDDNQQFVILTEQFTNMENI